MAKTNKRKISKNRIRSTKTKHSSFSRKGMKLGDRIDKLEKELSTLKPKTSRLDACRKSIIDQTLKVLKAELKSVERQLSFADKKISTFLEKNDKLDKARSSKWFRF